MDQSHNMQRANYPPGRQGNYRDGHDFDDDDVYEDEWPSRMPSSTRRYQGDVRMEMGRTQPDVQSQREYRASYPTQRNTIPPRRTATQTHIPAVQPGRRHPVDTEDVLPRRSDTLVMHGSGSGPRFHWLVFVGGAMLVMMVGWLLLSMLMNWWQVTQDDWHYGRPRTFQTDFVVGHNDSEASPSHFVALNIRRHVEILEFPGGDSSKMKVYDGPVLIGQGQDLAVVTLSFKDVNGDSKPDMIVTVQDSRFVFINDKGTFRPIRPGEKVQM